MSGFVVCGAFRGTKLMCMTQLGEIVFQITTLEDIHSIAMGKGFIVVGTATTRKTGILEILSFQGVKEGCISVSSTATCISINNDADRFACILSDGSVAVFRRLDTDWVQIMQWETRNLLNLSIAWIGDDQIVLTSGFGMVSMWNSETGKELMKLDDPIPRKARCLTVTEDSNGSVLFCGYWNGIVRRWNLMDCSYIENIPRTASVNAICVWRNIKNDVSTNNGNDIVVIVSTSCVAVGLDAVTLRNLWSVRCDSEAISLTIIDDHVMIPSFGLGIVVLDVTSGQIVRKIEFQDIAETSLLISSNTGL